jgi:hypothetical protein
MGAWGSERQKGEGCRCGVFQAQLFVRDRLWGNASIETSTTRFPDNEILVLKYIRNVNSESGLMTGRVSALIFKPVPHAPGGAPKRMEMR